MGKEHSAGRSAALPLLVHLDSERRNRLVASALPNESGRLKGRPLRGPHNGIGQSSAGRGGHQRLTRSSICLSAAIALVSAAREADGTEVS
jgi:hypothetical protein